LWLRSVRCRGRIGDRCRSTPTASSWTRIVAGGWGVLPVDSGWLRSPARPDRPATPHLVPPELPAATTAAGRLSSFVTTGSNRSPSALGDVHLFADRTIHPSHRPSPATLLSVKDRPQRRQASAYAAGRIRAMRPGHPDSHPGQGPSGVQSGRASTDEPRDWHRWVTLG
jgi:hypothetical protein